MKIWVVEGTTGEYSDRNDWSVCAYMDQQKAEDHARFAMLRAMEIQKSKKNRYDSVDLTQNEFDPKMQMDYNGTSYYTCEVELVC